MTGLPLAVLAGIPVIHDGGSPAETVAAVAAHTGLPTDQLSALPLEDLLRAPPRALGAATLRHCAGTPTTMAEVQAAAVRAEAAWRQADIATAMDQLDLGMAQAGCLSERVDGPVLVRMFLLRGGLLAKAGQMDLAAAELSSALAIDPAARWSEVLPVEGSALFDAARTETVDVELALVPPGSASGPWIDGRPAEGDAIRLRRGLHLVQVASTGGIRSAWLANQGEAMLVVPGRYRRPVLEGVADPATRAPLEALLRGALDPFDAAYVAVGGGLWLLSAEEGGVTTTLVVEPPKPREEGGKRRRR